MSKRMYMAIDTVILTVLACVLEALNVLLLKKAFKAELFSVSILIPMTVLVLIRWKWPAGITAVLCGLVYCLCLSDKAQGYHYLVYGAGNLFMLINLVWFVFLPRKKISGSLPLSMLFVLTAYLSLELGRACMAAITGHGFLPALVDFLTIDALNLLIGALIIFIARRQKNLFVSQSDYLKEMQEEREKEALKNAVQKEG